MADLLERLEDGVAILTLNRPERRNAMSGEMIRLLHAALSRAARDHSIGCVLLTGAGGAFCAGGDFSPDRDRSDGIRPVFVNARHLVFNWLDCEKPVISAVNGYAMGLGATVALFADVVIEDDPI